MDPTEVKTKVKIAKNIVVLGDDFQVRIFSSGSQPNKERRYFVLFEDAYGEQNLEIFTEAELNASLAKATDAPHSVEEMLRMANQDRMMNEYSFPAPTPIEMKDI